MTTKGKMIMKSQDSTHIPAVLYRVNEAAEAMRLSRSMIYELIRSGRLRTVQVGRRRLVPVQALTDYVDALGGEAA
jgi:excisionase family DNA binding protein